MKYLEMWACRNELDFNDRIIISQEEPEFYLGNWKFSKNQIIFSIGLNDLDVSLTQGSKLKVKLSIESF